MRRKLKFIDTCFIIQQVAATSELIRIDERDQECEKMNIKKE